MQRKQVKNEKRVQGGNNFVRIGIVVSEFNSDITRLLLDGALRALKDTAVSATNISVVTVPGSFELPLACQKLAKTGTYDALVALGCVIKGETDHYHHVAQQSARGIMDVMLKFSIPIGFGVLTVDTLAQARERAGKKIDAGGCAARVALRMISSE